MTIIFLLLFMCLADPCLCVSDNIAPLSESNDLQDHVSASTLSQPEQERLDSLKSVLTTDILKWNNVKNEYSHSINLLKEAKNRPERHRDIEEYLFRLVSDKYVERKNCLNKIRLTESIIKTIDPNYISNIPKQEF